MKALSLIQPWATFIVIGAKRIETRNWRTHYRGPLLIHASRKFPRAALLLCYEAPYYQALAAAGYDAPADLPRGAMIGAVELVDCALIGREIDPPQPPELHYGDYREGRYAWLLENAREFNDPIPARGALRLFDWKPPPGVNVASLLPCAPQCDEPPDDFYDAEEP